MPIRGARTISAVAVCLVVLGACDGDPKKDPTSSPPSTATSTPTTPSPTGPTEPTLPEAAKANTPAGAAAFVEYYIALMNYAANTGDTSPMRRASTTCRGCDNYADLYKKTYAAGGYFKTDGWTPIRTEWSKLGKTFGVTVTVDAPPVTYRTKAGAEELQSTKHVYVLLFTVIPSQTNWSVTSLRDGGKK